MTISQAEIPKEKWLIHYESPPLRAIYFKLFERCSKRSAVEMFKIKHPDWIIRKVTSYVEID